MALCQLSTIMAMTVNQEHWSRHQAQRGEERGNVLEDLWGITSVIIPPPGCAHSAILHLEFGLTLNVICNIRLKSFPSLDSQVPSTELKEPAITFASIMEWETIFCFLDNQHIVCFECVNPSSR